MAHEMKCKMNNVQQQVFISARQQADELSMPQVVARVWWSVWSNVQVEISDVIWQQEVNYIQEQIWIMSQYIKTDEFFKLRTGD